MTASLPAGVRAGPAGSTSLTGATMSTVSHREDERGRTSAMTAARHSHDTPREPRPTDAAGRAGDRRRRARCRRALRTPAAVLALAAVGALAPGVALAGTDVLLGQVAPAGVTGASAAGSAVELAGSAPPGYVFPSGGGYVHSWQVQDDAQPGQLQLLILTPSVGGYVVAAESPAETAMPGALDTFTAPFLRGDVGDVLALSSTGPPLSFATANGDQTANLGAAAPPLGSRLTSGAAQSSSDLNLAAAVTPPADVTVGTTLHHPPPPPPIPPPVPGSEATLPHAGFSFEVTNAGPNEVDGVVLTVSAPSGVSLSGWGYGPEPTTGPITVANGFPQETCVTTASGLACPVGHLDPGTSIDYEISTGAVPAGTYTATGTVSGTIGDAACPLSTCDPDQANNAASDTDTATGTAFHIGLTPLAPPSLARLRVVPARLALPAAAARPAPARIEALLSEPEGALPTRTRFGLLKQKPGITRPHGCSYVRHTRLVPAARRCTRQVRIASFTAATAPPPQGMDLPRTIPLDVALPEKPGGRILTPGRYDLSAAPSYTDLPAGTVPAPSPQPLTLTIGPGACVGMPARSCPPLEAVIAHGTAIATGFTVLAARRPGPK